jgi:hypothetical protein
MNSRRIGLLAAGAAGLGIIPLVFVAAATVPFALVAVAIGAGLALELRYLDESPPE